MLKAIRKNITQSEASCTICGFQEFEAIYTFNYNNKTCQIFQCKNCTHLFVHPIPLATLSERNMDGFGDAEFWGNNFLKWLHENFVINKEVKSVKKISGFTDNATEVT